MSTPFSRPRSQTRRSGSKPASIRPLAFWWARLKTRWSHLSTLCPQSSPARVSWSMVRPSARPNISASTEVVASSSTQAWYSSGYIGGSYR